MDQALVVEQLLEVEMQEEVAQEATQEVAQAEAVELVVQINSNVLMAVNALTCHGSAMALQKMEMLLGDLIALMAVMKTLPPVAQQESMRISIAQELKPPINLMRRNAQMDSVSIKSMCVTGLVQLVPLLGDLIVRMVLMRTLPGAVHILGNTQEEKGTRLVFVE